MLPTGDIPIKCPLLPSVLREVVPARPVYLGKESLDAEEYAELTPDTYSWVNSLRTVIGGSEDGHHNAMLGGLLILRHRHLSG